MAKVRYRDISPELEKLATPVSSQNSRVSIGFEDEVGEFYYFSVDDLIPYKNQARSIFDEDEINKLSDTIKQHGVRQPLSIIKSKIVLDKYEVVSGERRLRAAKLAALKKVPCIIIKDEKDADEISLIENIQRQDLHPLELAKALQALLQNKPYGAKAELAKRIGLSSSQISETLSLLTFDPAIREAILQRSFRGRENFRRLLSMDSVQNQKEYIESFDGDSVQNQKGSAKKITKSIIRIAMVDGILKVQSYSLNKISEKEKQDVKKALENIIEQLDMGSFRGRENFGQ